MRIVCLGNQNNNLFAVTRFLRDLGHDCELWLFDNDPEHFRPEADSFDSAYRGYTRAAGWGSLESFVRTPARTVREALAPFDAVIGCGNAPALLARAGRVLDLFVPYGSDLYLYPFFRWRPLGNPRYQHRAWRLARAQRRGIRDARRVQVNNDYAAPVLALLGFRGETLDAPVPMIYTPHYDPDAIAAHIAGSRRLGELVKVRDAHDLVVFHHARHLWRSSPDALSWKGNDRLVRGFAAFCARRPDVRACLVTCEYGPDVQATRRLVEELGIGARVHWLPQMSRKDLIAGLTLADIGTGEFEMGWFLGGTVAEVLAMGRPLLHYRKEPDAGSAPAASYPLVNAREPEQIYAALLDWCEHPEAWTALGAAGRRWLHEHLVARPLREYRRIFGAVPGGGRPGG